MKIKSINRSINQSYSLNSNSNSTSLDPTLSYLVLSCLFYFIFHGLFYFLTLLKSQSQSLPFPFSFSFLFLLVNLDYLSCFVSLFLPSSAFPLLRRRKEGKRADQLQNQFTKRRRMAYRGERWERGMAWCVHTTRSLYSSLCSYRAYSVVSLSCSQRIFSPSSSLFSLFSFPFFLFFFAGAPAIMIAGYSSPYWWFDPRTTDVIEYVGRNEKMKKENPKNGRWKLDHDDDEGKIGNRKTWKLARSAPLSSAVKATPLPRPFTQEVSRY